MCDLLFEKAFVSCQRLLETTLLVNGLPVRVLEKAGLGFDFTKTQLTGTVSGF